MFKWINRILDKLINYFNEKNSDIQWDLIRELGVPTTLGNCEECKGYEVEDGNTLWTQQCLDHKNYWIRRAELEAQNKETQED